MRPALAIPAGLALALLAFGVSFSAPDTSVMEAPFPTTGSIGDEIVSEHLVVTVHDVSLADEVELESWTGTWEGTTAGIWLVVEATVAGRVDRVNVDADVLIDGVQYPATGRIDTDALNGRVADAGLPVSGPILIELPADVLEQGGARSAVLRIGPDGDVRLDAVVDVRLDLTALETQDRIVLEPARDGAR
ncbi:hypothetical protein [Pseudolysinimonas sp.]